MKRSYSRILAALWGRVYTAVIVMVMPLNLLLCLLLRWHMRPYSVVHVAELRHIGWNFVDVLKRRGHDATFVGLDIGGHWKTCDKRLLHQRNPILAALRDTWLFWSLIAPHSIVHSHCMMGLSHYQWEFLLLKLMGRRLIAHFRGCEARNRSRNLALHPTVNICQDCDYLPRPLCEERENRRRRWVARHMADAIVVTTPDMRDFFPTAIHLPFFAPPMPMPAPRPAPEWGPERPMRIVHVTNQPGIEGTARIRAVVEQISTPARPVELVHVTGIPWDQVLQEYRRADISIGKMKMGYYANAQIESMILGVPAITWVRPDLLTPPLSESAFLLTDFNGLGNLLQILLDDPGYVTVKASQAYASILSLHDEDNIYQKLKTIYGWN